MLPTCPIRKVKEIDKAINILKKLNYLISVENNPIEWCHKVSKKGFLKKQKICQVFRIDRIFLNFIHPMEVFTFNTSSF